MLNLACSITLLRVLLTPIIVALMLHDHWPLAFGIFIIAIVTDLLDGFVARRFNQQSKFGQLLDPIADKILLGSVMTTMLLSMPATVYILYAVRFLLLKELILLCGGGILWFGFKKFIQPSVLSRAVSLCEVILVFTLFISKSSLVHIPQVLIFSIIMINVFVSLWLLMRYFGAVKGMKLH